MTVTLLQLSDVHLAEVAGTPVNGRDADARLATVLAAWHELDRRADLVVLSGDNSDDASPAACRRLADAVAGLEAPVLAVAGNHDDPGVVAAAFGSHQSVDVGEWRVVGLDTSRPGQIHGSVDVDVAVGLLDDEPDRPTVVVLHHPPVSTSTNPWFRLEGAAALLDALGARSRVRVALSGHLHEAFERRGPGGLALLGCPSTLIAIAHRGDEMEIGADAPTGARVVELADDGTWSSTLLLA